MQPITRKNCVLCNHDITFLKCISIPKLPVSTKNVSNNLFKNDLYCDFNIVTCCICGTSQLSTLIPLDILYDENPQMTQGQTFKEMFNSFSLFIKQNCEKSETFLEIGDPACKTLNSCLKNDLYVKKWTIIDPNLEHIENVPTCCERIKGWFDISNEYDKVDCIITSHVFEHFYEPSVVLQKFKNISDKLIFCLPNMSIMAETSRLPPLGMIFQHTFYLDENILKIMFKYNGWNIEKIEYFKDNSIFLYATKYYKEYRQIIEKIDNNSEKFLIKVVNRVKNFIKYIKTLKFDTTDKIYLFGSHFGTQILVSEGILETCNILGILDNNSNKNGKRLYGTPLTVYNPKDIFKEFKKIFIIMFPYQAYDNEIKTGLNTLSVQLKTEIIYITPRD